MSLLHTPLTDKRVRTKMRQCIHSVIHGGSGDMRPDYYCHRQGQRRWCELHNAADCDKYRQFPTARGT